MCQPGGVYVRRLTILLLSSLLRASSAFDHIEEFTFSRLSELARAGFNVTTVLDIGASPSAGDWPQMDR